MADIKLKQIDCNSKDFMKLCSRLDKFLDQAIGGESIREKYKKFNHLDTMDYVIAAYDEEKPVGCGALRKYSAEDIEVKRVFVQKEYRRKNVGGMLLEQLIKEAKEMGFRRMILETGDFLQASMRLYSRYGFERIENYGVYAEMAESVCMALNIGDEDITYCVDRWILAEDIKKLFRSVGWLSAGYADRLSEAFKKAGTVLTAWQNERLIGLIEVLDDGGVNAYIHYLLVDPEFQKQGIGTSMINRIKRIYKDYLYLIVICEKRGTIPFYEKSGFSVESGTTPLQIRTL